MKQSRHGINRLERPYPPKNFSPIVASHPHWTDSRGLLINIQIGSVFDLDTRICKKNRTLRIIRKSPEEIFSDWNDLMLLAARARYFSRYDDVLTIAKASSKRVARK